MENSSDPYSDSYLYNMIGRYVYDSNISASRQVTKEDVEELIFHNERSRRFAETHKGEMVPHEFNTMALHEFKTQLMFTATPPAPDRRYPGGSFIQTPEGEWIGNPVYYPKA